MTHGLANFKFVFFCWFNICVKANKQHGSFCVVFSFLAATNKSLELRKWKMVQRQIKHIPTHQSIYEILFVSQRSRTWRRVYIRQTQYRIHNPQLRHNLLKIDYTKNNNNNNRQQTPILRHCLFTAICGAISRVAKTEILRNTKFPFTDPQSLNEGDVIAKFWLHTWSPKMQQQEK
jgi:hypothetical protein